MSEKASHSGGWVVEVFDDSVGSRHRRYMVGAETREDAIAAVQSALGQDLQINSTSAVTVAAFGATGIKPGEVRLI
jgi:hypothetical protein